MEDCHPLPSAPCPSLVFSESGHKFHIRGLLVYKAYYSSFPKYWKFGLIQTRKKHAKPRNRDQNLITPALTRLRHGTVERYALLFPLSRTKHQSVKHCCNRTSSYMHHADAKEVISCPSGCCHTSCNDDSLFVGARKLRDPYTGHVRKRLFCGICCSHLDFRQTSSTSGKTRRPSNPNPRSHWARASVKRSAAQVEWIYHINRKS